MKYCPHCGKELVDDAVVCTGCGRSLEATAAPADKSKTNNTLGLVAKIFLIISMAGCLIASLVMFIAASVGGEFLTNLISDLIKSETGLALKIDFAKLAVIQGITYLIPLCWMVPMTITLWRKLQNDEPITTSFKVCTLLFCNLIAGIVLLCRTETPVQHPAQL